MKAGLRKIIPAAPFFGGIKNIFGLIPFNRKLLGRFNFMDNGTFVKKRNIKINNIMTNKNMGTLGSLPPFFENLIFLTGNNLDRIIINRITYAKNLTKVTGYGACAIKGFAITCYLPIARLFALSFDNNFSKFFRSRNSF